MRIGEEILGIVRTLDPSLTTVTDHMVARAAGRFLEEAVELALALGLHPKAAMGHVADAIHNECRKRGCFPSEYPPGAEERSEMVAELADIDILTAYLAELIGASPEEVDRAADAKMAKFRTSLMTGNLKIIDGLIYRKDTGR